MEKQKASDAIDRAIEALTELKFRIAEDGEPSLHDAIQEVVAAYINLQETVLPVKAKKQERQESIANPEGNSWDGR